MSKYNIYINIKEEKKTIEYIKTFCEILYVSIINNGYLIQTSKENEIKFKINEINSFKEILS